MKKHIFCLMFLVFSTDTLANSQFDSPYVGIQLGYIKGDSDLTEGWSGQSASWWVDNIKPQGSVVGFYAGLNKVFDNNFLLGLEVDANLLSADKTKDGHWAGHSNEGYPVKVDYNYSGSLRARAGYVFNQDTTLLFVTFGGGFANIKSNYYNQNGTEALTRDTSNYFGWTAGLGAEYCLTNSLSLKAEYIYSDLGSKTLHDTVYSGSTDTWDKITVKNDVVRVGLHYRF